MATTNPDTPPMTRRDRRRQETINDIKTAAREQLAERGPAGISLRGIARELNITASAVHYYFPGREALLDALILDGYNSLAEALRTAHKPARDRPPAAQWMAVCHGHRSWALQFASQYLLLYGHGGRVAGRRHPKTHEAMSGVVEVLFTVMRSAVAAGDIDTERIAAAIPPSLRNQLGKWRKMNGSVQSLPDGALAGCLITYAQLHGAITLELVGHIPPQLRDRAALFELEMLHAYTALRYGSSEAF